MRAVLLFLPFITCIGCSRSQPPSTRAAIRSDMIFLGQRWGDAESNARSAGYKLYPASQLAILPVPDGFVVDLPEDRWLIVYRESKSNSVGRLQLVENFSVSKDARVYHPIQSFNLPKR